MVNSAPWGKFSNGESHHLAHHCADVAACFEALLSLPVVRVRLERSAGTPLSSTHVARLAVLAFLHDCGKLHPGFQAKGWPKDDWRDVLHGHVREGAAIFRCRELEIIAQNLHIERLIEWGVDEHLLFSVLAHHGRPFVPDEVAEKRWRNVPQRGYDPVAASAVIGKMVRHWFKKAFVADAEKLPATSDFQHLLCGLVSLADWLGSTRDIFTFSASLDSGYMDKTREKARQAVKKIGVDVSDLRRQTTGRANFPTLTGGRQPRAQQQLVGDYPLEELLVILESETGSGKTEAALWRFARLFEAGRVDSLYFALPTRAAAIQIQRRVNDAMQRLFGEGAPEAVLAVPGYLKAGEAEGKKLPDWKVRWDDDDGADEAMLLARWAAESVKRALAATIAVGTVDQAMLAALQVKHAHLRAAALSRSLLVIDEVHASDRYMTEVQKHLLEMHVGRGGHAMLMSATLGSVARAKWLGNREPAFEEAIEAPYPAVWGRNTPTAACDSDAAAEKHVALELVSTMVAETAARLAIEAARAGARVLVIRNTVTEAIATFDAVRQAGADKLLLTAANGPALHHGRFAPEDRWLLDEAVEHTLSPKPDDREPGGCIVIGTQTLEQSLDIDADFLLTDLCPIDVLLQRIGRLHRHPITRPDGFASARCHVMAPKGGLKPLLKPAFINGLGAWRADGVLNGIYQDVSGLELTRRLIESRPEWILPTMNRFLVESATHCERIEALHKELGEDWERYSHQVYGRIVAEAGAARGVVLNTGKPFADLCFPNNEEKIRTRLGAEGARIVFAAPVTGPFGAEIGSLTLPAHWSRGISAADCEAVVPIVEPAAVRLEIGKLKLRYDYRGIVKTK